MIELQHIIDSKKEVLSRETYSRNPINYSEGMADDQKDRFIQYLAEQHQEDELTIKAMKLVLEDFMNNQKSLDEQMASFQSKLQMMEDKHKELQHELSEDGKNVNRQNVMRGIFRNNWIMPVRNSSVTGVSV